MTAGTEMVGRVALVTGASSGLGAQIAGTLGAHGAHVFFAARGGEDLDAKVAAARRAGSAADSLRLDVTSEDSVAAGFDRIAARGRVADAVIVNAGVNRPGLALDLDMADFDALFAVNLRGAFLTAREAARRLVAAGRPGVILLIASIGGQTVLPGVAAYCASKAGLVMLGKALAREWLRHGIRVNVLCPGYVETALNADWFASEAGQRQARGFPARRPMGPDALDSLVLHLCGPGSAATTGAVITVDEGQSL